MAGDGRKPQLELAALSPVLCGLGLGEATGSEYLAGGSSPSWRIDLADGSAVVVRTLHESAPRTPDNELFVARLLEQLELPTKHYLHFDDSLSLLPRPFVITNHLDGRPVRDFLGDPDIADLQRQMGALLRQLHELRLDRFGFFGADGPTGLSDPDRWLRTYVVAAFHEFRVQGADPGLAEKLEAYVMARVGILRDGGGPVFAHNDLNPGNVLAERSTDGRLRLTGLIDYGSAFAAPALFDLAKTLFICAHEMPGSNPAILEGYGPIDHADPEAAIRLYLLLHRVVMWGWLRRYGTIGEGEEGELIRDLRAMVEADGSDRSRA